MEQEDKNLHAQQPDEAKRLAQEKAALRRMEAENARYPRY